MSQTTKKKTTNATESYQWLVAVGRDGRRRSEKLGWKRLARIYYANRPGSRIRKAVNAECRRLGYTPSTILSLHAE